jgi:hypothetical protein
LHDSQGFEPGEAINYKKVQEFLERRRKATNISDRIHAVWSVLSGVVLLGAYSELRDRLCIEVPFANGRVLETADEQFLKHYYKGADQDLKGKEV